MVGDSVGGRDLREGNPKKDVTASRPEKRGILQPTCFRSPAWIKGAEKEEESV
ncbi:putative RNA-dependent RNA polymerase 3 [Anopheles sinensis]|uniref:Putative RNA-dependent RNA polymerase 3 n=1 Tax=Anopheles sinensis TaxID=74873 RepID=A0A084VB49_ANOSI|nr:putative RNA-dependent RNA polymerase 3 [Anopheles sinensis]